MLRYTVSGKQHSIDGNAFYGLEKLHDLFQTTKPAKPAPEPPVEPDRPTYTAAYNARLRVMARAIEEMTPPVSAGGSEAVADVLAMIGTLQIGGDE